MTQKSLPKYVELIEEIKRWITSGKFQPGQQIPTEHELAKSFHVSRHTVRQSISELVHQGWLYREQGRGTFLSPLPIGGAVPSVPAKTSPSHVIGVITTYISDYIFPSIIRGIDSKLAPEGYSILLLSTHNDFEQEARALQTLIQKNVDGIIVEPTKSTYQNPNIKLYFSLLEQHIPFVMLHSAYEELSAPSVRINDVESATLVTEELVDAGHTRLGAIFKSDDMQGKLRLKGFLQTLHKHSIAPMSNFISLYSTENKRDIAREYVQQLRNCPADKRPTGLVCYNDEIAVDVIDALKEAGFQIPSDISVVSFDNSQWAEAGEVKLTSVEHPKYEMGVKAAELILQEIARLRFGINEFTNDFVFPSRIVERSSIAKYAVPEYEAT